MVNNKVKKKKRKAPVAIRLLTGLMLITFLIALILFYMIDMLPLYFMVIITLIGFIFELLIIKILRSRKPAKSIFGAFLSLIIVILLGIGISYEVKTLDFFGGISGSSTRVEVYNILVLKNSSYESLEDMKNEKIGRLNIKRKTGLQDAIKEFKDKVYFIDQEYDDILDLVNHLEERDISGAILEDAQLELLKEENEELYNDLKIIHSTSINYEVEAVIKEKSTIDKPFNIYISGIDTYGSINKVSRSDVNIVVTFNPETNEFLLTSIPRDYYVTLSSYNEKDKLTHAGIYGIDESLSTIENLLDIKIDYYFRVNFTSLINIVDTLGGIEVDSEYAFTAFDGTRFTKGINKLDGKKTLSFSRERKAFEDGDRVRGENQQRVLTSILNKVTSSAVITKYNDLLDAVKGNFVTNLDIKDIKDIVKHEISTNKPITIKSISLDGTDSFDYTYSYKKNKLYVMIPDEESINEAKIEIKRVLDS